MAAAYHLIKALIRAATTAPNGIAPVPLAHAIARLTRIVSGHFETLAAGDGTIQVSSQIGDTAFTFATAGDLDRPGIMALAEQALERLETCTTTAQARAKYLTRRTTTRPDFGGLRP